MGFIAMSSVRFEVVCCWDAEAKVWYVSDSNVPGLVAEAPTKEAMEALLLKRIPELLQLNQPDLCERRADDVPLELLFQRREELRVHC